MKINWPHLIFILAITACSLTLFFWLIFTIGNEKREKRQQYLRDSYSPMSEDAEIQEAYDAIRNQKYE